MGWEIQVNEPNRLRCWNRETGELKEHRGGFNSLIEDFDATVTLLGRIIDLLGGDVAYRWEAKDLSSDDLVGMLATKVQFPPQLAPLTARSNSAEWLRSEIERVDVAIGKARQVPDTWSDREAILAAVDALRDAVAEVSTVVDQHRAAVEEVIEPPNATAGGKVPTIIPRPRPRRWKVWSKDPSRDAWLVVDQGSERHCLQGAARRNSRSVGEFMALPAGRTPHDPVPKEES